MITTTMTESRGNAEQMIEQADMNEESVETRRRERADTFTPPKDDSDSDPTSFSTGQRVTPPSSVSTPTHRSGRWAPDEKILFLYGLKRFGKGRWKKMSIYLPHRSLVQIKSHAQKVLKRLEAGENVFRRLDENYGVIDSLIVQAAKQRDAAVGSVSTSSSRNPSASTSAKRKRTKKSSSLPSSLESTSQSPSSSVTGRTSKVVGDYINQNLVVTRTDAVTNPNAESADTGGRGAVIAAAALCQLSSRGSWDKAHQGAMQKTC